MKRFIIILLFVLIIFTLNNTVYANNNDIDFSNTISQVEEHFVFKDSFQLSEEQLLTIKTQELIKEVIEYPFFVNLFAFNSFSEGFENVIRNYNGLQELIGRDDAGKYLLQMYKDTPIFKDGISDNLFSNFKHIIVLEAILSQVEIFNQFDKVQYDSLILEVHNKYLLKSELDNMYSFTKSIFLSFFFEQEQDFTHGGFYFEFAGYVYTYFGDLVPVHQATDDFTQWEIDSINQWVQANYGYVKRLRQPTTMFNCHSYAWHNSDAFNNFYWMNNPDPYTIDGSYASSTGIEGDIITYVYDESNIHSGMIINRLSGTPDPNYGYVNIVTVVSKWGLLGLYEHNGLICPYIEPGVTIESYRFRKQSGYSINWNSIEKSYWDCAGLMEPDITPYTYITYAYDFNYATRSVTFSSIMLTWQYPGSLPPNYPMGLVIGETYYDINNCLVFWLDPDTSCYFGMLTDVTIVFNQTDWDNYVIYNE